MTPILDTVSNPVPAAVPTTPATPLLDEKALRRPTFLGGREITLADGQEWFIPVPQLYLVITNSRSTGYAFDYCFGGNPDPEFSRLRQQYEENDEPRESLSAQAKMIAHAISLNYDLTDEQAASILRFPAGPNADRTSMNEVLAALAGVDDENPKEGGPSQDGSSELL